MKRILSLITALVIVLGASSAMAETKEFFYTGYMLTYGTWDTSFVKSGMKNAGSLGAPNYQPYEKLNYEFFAQRIRPYFSYKTDNVEATIKFEADWIMGSGDASATLAAGKDKHVNVGIGADTPSFLELKEAYIKMNILDVPGLTLMGGINGLFYAGWGAGYYAEETPQVRAYYSFGNQNVLGKSNVNLAFVPIMSGDTFTYDKKNNADSSGSLKMNLYVAEGNITIDTDSAAMKITPTLWVAHAGKNTAAQTSVGSVYTPGTLYHGETGFIPGLGFLGVFNGKLQILANVAVPFGKSDEVNPFDGKKIEYFAIFASLDATYTLKMGQKVGLHFMYLSGDDDPSDHKRKALTDQQFDFVTPLGGRFWFFETGVFSPLVGGNNLVYNPADITRLNEQGAYILGFWGEFTFGKITTYAGIATAMAAYSASGVSTSDKFFGVEADLSVAYKVDGARFFVEGAVLLPGDGYKFRTIGWVDGTGTPYTGGTAAFFGSYASISEVKTAVHFSVGMDITF